MSSYHSVSEKYDVFGVINGNIYASFEPLIRVKALALAYGRVLAIGDESYVKRLVYDLGGDVIDIGGRPIIPGFIDAHIHLDGLALALKSLNLRGMRSIGELKLKLKEFIENNPDVEVVYGRGWDQELFVEGRWPTRYDVDDVISDKPVVLVRICGHAALLNTKAMEDLGLMHSRSKDVIRDERGVPTGIVKESIIDLVTSYVRNKLMRYDTYIHDTLNYILSHGVTTIGYVSACMDVINTLTKFVNEGITIPRIYAYLNVNDFYKFTSLIKTPLRSNFISIIGVKVFLDGSLGARTALLSEPYSDDLKNKGQELISVDDLVKLMYEAFSKGFQVAAHAIGDKAIDIAIMAYKKACPLIGGSKGYLRIEHASIIRPDQIRELRKLGIAVSIQPRFVISDWWVVRRVGIRRVRWVYPFKTLKHEGLAIGLSTDAPVEPLNPWETIYAAVTRGSFEGIELSKYTMEESLSILEALHLYTYGSARVLGIQDLGRLLPGYKADFLVLDRDPLAVSHEMLRKIEILEVWVNGYRVKHKK